MADGGADISQLGKIAGYTEILSKDPHSTVFVPLSEAYRSMGMLDEAIEVAMRGNAAVPGYAPGYITLGRSLAERGRLGEADASFTRALQLEETNLQALKGLARVKMLQRLPEQARPLLVAACQLAPDDATITKMLASLGAPPPPPASPPATAAPVPAVAAVRNDVPIATVTVAEIYERQGLYRKAFKVYHDLYQNDSGNQELRRKLAQLKQLIETGAEATAKPTSVLGSATPVEPATPAPSVAPPQTAPTVQATPQQELQATYHRWLEVIQSRRPHV